LKTKTQPVYGREEALVRFWTGLFGEGMSVLCAELEMHGRGFCYSVWRPMVCATAVRFGDVSYELKYLVHVHVDSG